MKKYWKDQMTILITGACDARCQDCAVKFRKKPVHLSTDLIKTHIFPSLAPYHEVAICGGEPTLHPKFEEIAKELLKRTSRVSVVTNGACASNPEKARRFFNFLDENPELTIILSADSQHEQAVPNFRARLERFLGALAERRIGFKVTEATPEKCEDTISRFGLPAERTITSVLWEKERLDNFGTERRIFISESGDVFDCMASYLRGGKPIGQLSKESLADLVNRVN